MKVVKVYAEQGVNPVFTNPLQLVMHPEDSLGKLVDNVLYTALGDGYDADLIRRCAAKTDDGGYNLEVDSELTLNELEPIEWVVVKIPLELDIFIEAPLNLKQFQKDAAHSMQPPDPEDNIESIETQSN